MWKTRKQNTIHLNTLKTNKVVLFFTQKVISIAANHMSIFSTPVTEPCSSKASKNFTTNPLVFLPRKKIYLKTEDVVFLSKGRRDYAVSAHAHLPGCPPVPQHLRCLCICGQKLSPIVENYPKHVLTGLNLLTRK